MAAVVVLELLLKSTEQKKAKKSQKKKEETFYMLTTKGTYQFTAASRGEARALIHATTYLLTFSSANSTHTPTTTPIATLLPLTLRKAYGWLTSMRALVLRVHRPTRDAVPFPLSPSGSQVFPALSFSKSTKSVSLAQVDLRILLQVYQMTRRKLRLHEGRRRRDFERACD